MFRTATDVSRERFGSILRPLVFAVLLLSGSNLAVEAQIVPGLEVVRSDATGLEVIYTPVYRFESLPDGLLLPTVEGGLIGAGAPGSPVDPIVALPVGLPPSGRATMEIVSVTYNDLRTATIAPVPTFRSDAEGIVSEEYVVDPNAYRNHRAADGPATMQIGGRAAGLDVGRLEIRPVRYNGSGGIETLERIHLRVRYAGSVSTTGSRNTVVPEGLRSSLVNGNIAGSWVKQPGQRLSAKQNSAAPARAWFRLEVDGEGLHAIGADDFRRAGIDPATIERVTVYGGAGTPLPEEVAAALDNDLTPLPTIIERSGSSISRVLFVASGTNGWEFRPFDLSDSIPRRVSNPYVKKNAYIVAVDGDPERAFATKSNPGAATLTAEHGIGRILFEEEQTNAIAQGNSGNGGGRTWFGTSFVVDDFRPEEKRVFPQELVALDRTYPITVRFRVAHNARNGGSGRFSFEQNGAPIGEELFIASFSGEQSTDSGDEILASVDPSTVPSDNRALLGVSYRYPTGGIGYLDFIEIHYGRRLAARNDRITFESPTGSGIAEYRVTGFSTNQLVGFDVTDPANPTRLETLSTDGGTFVFNDRVESDPTKRRRYLITALSAAIGVDELESTPFADLRSATAGADVIVVTHEDFREQADEYAAYRRSAGLTVAVATTDEIYAEFSSGRLDPTAIRDYVAHAYHNWNTRPRYLLLIGDGHYDYRGLTTDVPEYVPVFTSGERNFNDDIAVSVYDDYYVRVDGEDFYIDVAPGRLPVVSTEEAATVIDKIKRYESPSSYGPWRERVLLVADDNAPVNEAKGFLPQSETLERLHVPEWLETEKVYLQEYPDVQGVRRMKPGATQDLIQWINRGVLVVNWVGHGNARVWGHEHVLDKEEFIPQLTNDSTLAMIMAVTCNFGRFDNPNEVSGGELFLTHKGGGASVVLATTRAVYVNDNAALMYAYFRSLFLRDSVTNGFLRLGDALLATKIRGGARRDNDQKYVIFGDPVMRLAIPSDSVAIEQVNQVNVATDTARIKALGEVEVVGSLRDRLGNLQADFDGTVIITLYDADRLKEVPRQDAATPYEMDEKGGQLFRGPATVTDGRFTARFRIPKDIAFDSTRTASMFAYASRPGGDAVGATNNLIVFGSDTTGVTDGSGPDITIYLDDRSFRSGDIVTPTPMLLIDLSDPSGINASGAGLGHRIEAWIGDNPTPIDLTDFYATSPEDYRVGTAERELLDLEPGEYRVRVRAWDIFNNPSETTAFFRIVEGGSEELQVTEVFNYPNPMTKETAFLFRHNQTAPLDVDIDIFSPSGRKLRSLSLDGTSDRFVRVPWDGRDADGQKLGNGVYLWRLRVAVGEGADRRVIEVIERLAILR